MSKSKVRIGIIGSGFGLYGLLPAFNSTKNCQVVSICGKKTQRLVNYCQSISLNNIYEDWQKMLDKEKLDAVAIAVPPGLQYEIAKVAINKGLHIFAEKPLALNLSQAEELLNLANKKKIIHTIDFLFPEIEEWSKTKELLDSKKIGNLKQICLNWDFLSYDIRNRISSWKTDTKLGGGALSFYFSHSLYYLEYFAGKITNFKSQLIYSKDSLNGGETGVNLILKFENDVSGYAHLCCNARGLQKHELIFIGEKGTLVLRNNNSITSNFTLTLYSEKGSFKFLKNKKKKENNEDERVKVVKKITKKFIDAIKNKIIIEPSFSDGVRVQNLLDQIRSQKINYEI